MREKKSGESDLLLKLLDAAITPKTAAKLIMEEVLGPAFHFCKIPERYSHCTLGHHWVLPEDKLSKLTAQELEQLMCAPGIVNPRPCHMNAITFFKALLKGEVLVCENNSPFAPKIGLFLVGKSGCGKTHIMAAAAKMAQQELDKIHAGLEAEIEKLLQKELGENSEAIRQWKVDGNVRTVSIEGDAASGSAKTTAVGSIQERFAALLEKIREHLRKLPLQPTDVLYIGFDELYRYTSDDLEVRQRMLDAIAAARLVFIDDLHPKDDPERFTLAHHIIERRYESGKYGTFITSNLSAASLGGKERENSSQLTQRLVSRCKECFWTIEFKEECLDWRDVLRSQRVKEIDKAISQIARARIESEKKSIADELRQETNV